MNRFSKSATVAVAACVLLAVALITSFANAASQTAKATVGSNAPSFTLQDENGKPVSLAEYTGNIVVLEWTNPDCPFVQRHYKEKTMSTLASEFKPKGVVWLAINSTGTSDNAVNKAWVSDNQLSYPILNDAAGQVGKSYGAKSTPDMFIINKDGKIAYSGAIDNDPAGSMAMPTRINYVRQALNQLLAGTAVSTPETKSYGCAVHYAD